MQTAFSKLSKTFSFSKTFQVFLVVFAIVYLNGCSVGSSVFLKNAPQNISINISSTSAEKGSPLQFKISLSSSPSSAITVKYATGTGTASLGVHFLSVSGTLTFQAGETEKYVEVQTYSNSHVCEPSRTVALNLSDPSSGAVLSKASANGTIKDSTKPTLTITPTNATEGSDITFQASLNDFCNSSSVTFNYATVDGTATAPGRYTATSGVATIAAGSLTTTITVPTVGDGTYQGNQDFILAVSNVTNATITGSLNFTAQILDDESIPTIQFASSSSSLLESTAGGAHTFDVVLSNPTIHDVTVAYSITGGTATNGSDYSLNSSTTLAIPAGSTSVQVSLTVSDDALSEADETVIFTMGAVSNSTASGNTTHTFTITNDEIGFTNWTGAGGNNTWSNSANWDNGVPDATKSARLGAVSCGAFCSPTLGGNIDIGGLEISNTSSTVTMIQGGNNIVVRALGITQSASTFTGGSGSITVNGPVTISGGTFTSTSGTLLINATINNTIYFNLTAGTASTPFAHNNGTVELRGDANSNNTYKIYVPVGNYAMNHFKLSSTGGSSSNTISWLMGVNKAMIINGDFTMARASGSGYLTFDFDTTMNNQQLKGNLIIGAGAKGGNMQIMMNGTASRTYSVTGGGKAPRMLFSKTGGATLSTPDATYYGDSVEFAGTYTMRFPTGSFTIEPAYGTQKFFGYNSNNVTVDPSFRPKLVANLDCTKQTLHKLDLNGSATAKEFESIYVQWTGSSCALSRLVFGGVAGETAIVYGDLTLRGAHAGHDFRLSGTNNTPYEMNVQLHGNLTTKYNGNTNSDTTQITLNGSNTQTITTDSSQLFTGPWIINKTGGTVELAGHLYHYGSLSINSATTLNMNGYSAYTTTTATVGASATVNIGGCGATYLPSLTNNGNISYIAGAMALNSDGSNKSSFVLPNNSFQNTYLPGTGNGSVTQSKIFVQADGKVFVGGLYDIIGGSAQQNLVRLNTDGSKDASFDSSTNINGEVLDFYKQSTGKFIVGGLFTNNGGALRLNSDGSLDSSFGDYRTQKSYYPRILSLSNASFLDQLVWGEQVVTSCSEDCTTTSNAKIIRTNSTSGALDNSFQINSFSSSNQGVAGGSAGYLEQADGKVVAFGVFDGYAGELRNNIMRINTNGSLDSTFDVGSGFNSKVYAGAIQSDGKIILAGAFTKYNDVSVPKIVRLNTDGSLDTTFNTNLGTGFNNSVYAVKIQSDGKILVGGVFTSVNGTARNKIARLNTNGTLDTGFVPSTSFSNQVVSIDTDAANTTVYVGRSCENGL